MHYTSQIQGLPTHAVRERLNSVNSMKPFVKTLALASCYTFKTKLVRLCHKFKTNLAMAKLKCKGMNVKQTHSLEVVISNTHTHSHKVIGW